MNIVLGAAAAALMVLGAAELARLLVFWLRRPSHAGRMVLMVIPEGKNDCEHAVRAAAERLRWLDLRSPCGLVCVTRADDPELDSICRFLRLQYPFLRVCKPEEIEYTILQERPADGSRSVR